MTASSAKPVQLLRGDRVELVHTTDPYTELRPGDRGTVYRDQVIETHRYVDVNWDCGSTLGMLLDEGDRIRKLPVAVEA